MASDRMMALIAAERERQDARTDGGIRTHAAERNYLLALAVLTEEVGEAARSVLDLRYADVHDALRDELVQVAAVAIGWLEGMEAALDA